jgi:hypothetical protein
MIVRPTYEWNPGQGPDPASLERMSRAFPMPKVPMGEAWFMGETRRMFPQLAGDIHGLSTRELHEALEEIASGVTCFGPLEEWTKWYHYLLPRLVPRAHEGYFRDLSEMLVTGFMSQHPDGLAAEPYPGFREDALATLGRAIMAPEAWPGGKLDLEITLDKQYAPGAGRLLWDEVSGKLSASLFFCVKYLEADAIEPWFRSVTCIASPHWRAQVMVWLVGAHGLLTGRTPNPKALGENDWPQVEWDWSHCLGGNYTGEHTGAEPGSEFLPAENRRRLLAAGHRLVAEGALLEWVDSFAADPQLVEELLSLPERCFDLYSSPPQLAGTAR